MVEGFCAVRKGKRVIFLADEISGEARDRLADSVVRVTSAKQLTSTGRWPGRSGKLSVVRTRLEGAWVVVRRFTHGGILGGILPEITFGRRRILRELQVVNWAREHEVPTPRIVATSLQSWFGPLYRAHVITEEVPGACNMTEFFLRLPSLSDEQAVAYKRAAMEAVGKAIASMHAAGILHGDLHLRNVLVRIMSDASDRSATSDPSTELGAGRSDRPRVCARGYLLDFDRARIVRNITRSQRLANLRRLMRSVWKVQPARNQFALRDAVLFLRAYLGTSDRGEIERWVRDLSRVPWLHRLWWAVPKRERDERPIREPEGLDEP